MGKVLELCDSVASFRRHTNIALFANDKYHFRTAIRVKVSSYELKKNFIGERDSKFLPILSKWIHIEIEKETKAQIIAISETLFCFLYFLYTR